MISRLKDTLLLVGDVNSDRPQLREIFEASFNLLEAENLPQAAMLLEQNDGCIAAVLVDLTEMDEEDVLAVNRAAHWGSDNEIPILSLIVPTGDGSREELAFTRGASDVIFKPYTPISIRRRVQVLVDLHLHKWHLETLVQEQRETIRNANQIVLDALSAIIEHRNTESGNHVLRIRRFTKILLEDLAANCPEYNLTDTVIDCIASASTLHDIGKISIPDAILNKPGKLTGEEFEVMKTHTTVGSQLVQNLSGIGDVEYLRFAYNIALYHHERWDGQGYPAGLKGDDIPICAQVVGIADAFDALTTVRAYKPAFSYDQSINMILNGECGAFSPKLLESFKHVRSQFVTLAHQYSDGYSPKSDHITIPLPGPIWHKPELTSLQLSQVKYQTLLHYTNDTVIEFDLDSRLYHVMYSPNPDLETLLLNAPFEDIIHHLLDSSVHPDDRETVASIQKCFFREFFDLDLRKKTFRCRIYSPTQLKHLPYEITMLRVNTQNSEQRIVIVVLHRVNEAESSGHSEAPKSLHASPALYGLVSSALRCHCDKYMTIDEGARDLYALTGYTEDELQNRFAMRYTDLILPDDRPAFLEAMQTLMDSGGKTETEYRLVRKDGSTLWVLTKSRAYVEADGREYIYHAIRDNSLSKATYHQLQTTIERNQVIIDQSGAIIFEWNILSDTLYCSPKWEEHFGYKPISQNYGKQIGVATHFHPDDLPVFRDAVRQIKENHETISLDVRIANANAKYLWTKITATAYLDENGVLTRIIGMLQDIDALKQAEFTLKEQAERDPLTKLFNKASTQLLISEYLSMRDPDTMAAMLILDLDNFKQINDNYGHLYGDTILSQVSSTLKRHLRSQDIIGRIGGDAFLVFMCDIPNAELVNARCERLLQAFHDLMAQNAPGLNTSCSIGVSLVPYHGSSYTELFRHADEALYLSKNRGKRTYTIYDPSVPPTASAGINHTTRIDSDEDPGMANASFVRYVFRRLYESNDIIPAIDDILSYIGEQLNVSRVYIFENSDDNTTCSNTFEWCNEGIVPEKDELQNISYITDIPGWQNVYNERGIFYCTDITQLAPQFRAILEPQDIKSMLQCSINDQGVFRGYVGFDECSIHRMWTQEQINMLEFLAEVLAMFLLKKRTQDKAVAMAESLRHILDQQDNWTYVIDPVTCELKFLNSATRKLAPESEVGMVCYRAFMGRDSRCENCPARRDQQGKFGSAVIENPNLRVKVQASASEINWNGEASCLVTCRDLTNATD